MFLGKTLQFQKASLQPGVLMGTGNLPYGDLIPSDINSSKKEQFFER